MKFTKNDNFFLKAFEKALEDEELNKSLVDNEISVEYLRRNILIDSEMIWNVTNSEISELNSLHTKYFNQIIEENKNKERKNFHKKLKLFRTISLVLTVIILLGGIILYFFKREWFQFIFDYNIYEIRILYWIVIFSLSASLIIVVVEYLFESSYLMRVKGYEVLLRKSGGQDSNSIRSEINQKEETIKNILIESGIIPAITALVNSYSKPNYSYLLNLSYSIGLSEVHNQDLEVDTKSKDTLIQILEDMPGGSIGISGPRGIGKTTLLKSFMNYSKDRINEKELLTVFINAPVNYELREFVVHIFQKTIDEFLKLKGFKEKLHYNFFEQNVIKKNLITGMIYELSAPLIFIGLLLIMISFGIATTKSQPNESKATKQENTEQPKINESKNEKSISILDALEISAGDIFKLGLVSLFMGIGFYYSRIFKNKFFHFERDRHNSLNEVTSKIIEEALEWHKSLKYQQSFTTGWSGSLKFPIGIKEGISSSNSINVNPLSLPEIIEGLRIFLSKIGQEYTVVISIDELDKMEANERVVEFFNEIKSVFGVENCFFLVTVSEDAISNFEQRGLPFRDVFDSSFDDVIHLNYFNFDESKKLLNKRVIGLPVPYILLSHCLSGGLPRDLIRIIRRFIQVSAECGSNEMKDILTFFINEEIKSKLRSLMVKLNNYDSLKEMDLIAKCMIELNNDKFDIINLTNKLEQFTNKLQSKSENKKPKDLINLISNLSNYLKLIESTKIYFLSINDWQNNFSNRVKQIENIAFAKQSLSVNPNLSDHIIDEVISNLKTATNKGLDAILTNAEDDRQC